MSHWKVRLPLDPQSMPDMMLSPPQYPGHASALHIPDLFSWMIRLSEESNCFTSIPVERHSGAAVG